LGKCRQDLGVVVWDVVSNIPENITVTAAAGIHWNIFHTGSISSSGSCGQQPQGPHGCFFPYISSARLSPAHLPREEAEVVHFEHGRIISFRFILDAIVHIQLASGAAAAAVVGPSIDAEEGTPRPHELADPGGALNTHGVVEGRIVLPRHDQQGARLCPWLLQKNVLGDWGDGVVWEEALSQRIEVLGPRCAPVSVGCERNVIDGSAKTCSILNEAGITYRNIPVHP